MGICSRILPASEKYRLVGEFIKELKLRKYSFQTGRAYINCVTNFLKSGRNPREYLLSKSSGSNSTMRLNYFALRFFYEKVLKKSVDGEIPLAKRER